MKSLKNIFNFLINKEIPDISDKWSFIERSFLTIFIIVLTSTFIQFYPGIFLGFGLGDEFEWGMIKGFFLKIKEYNLFLFYGALGLLIFNVLFRIQVFLRGQWAYKTNHPDLPLKTIILLMSANSIHIIFVFMSVALMGLITWLLGYDFELGFNSVKLQVQMALTYANQLPTLLELPLLIAFILVYLIQGFVHYWIHRLCHISRFMWLILHRFHHMPNKLTTATTTVVISSIPFFLGMVFVKTFIFAAISKLFYYRPLYLEIFFLHLLLWIPEAYSHQSALYLEGLKKKWNLFLGQMQTGGTYHYLHHSNEEWVVNNNKTNQVNIGGGLFFCYDRLFGTFLAVDPKATKTPRIGLWGNPSLHHNPLRLALSGFLQICYELIHNKDLKIKFLCIFGSVNYTPPITKDYHISEKTTSK